jgi:perosamine synthetase
LSSRELRAPGAPVEAGDIPLCVPEIRGNEWAYVKECLDTNWVSSGGAYVNRFEQEVAARAGAAHGAATVNGTAALHVALLLAGVRPGDEVLVSTLTFIAPVNAIRYAGAHPVFVDADAGTWQMDAPMVLDFLDTSCHERGRVLRNRATGRRIAAILPVHILGHPVDMDPIVEAARRHRIAVVEDATESLGAEYRGRPVGHLGDVACFSFNGNKIITTGGGGMIVSDNERWIHRARYLTTQAKDDPVEYVHTEVGYNYRLTNLQAAMGVAQMEQLDAYIAAKRRIAACYAERLRAVPGLTPLGEAAWAKSTFWMSAIRVDADAYGMDSRALMRRLEERGIQTRPLWQPIHRSAAHSQDASTRCPVSERLNREALTLPCSVGLTAEQQERVIAEIAAGARR